jgi:homoserine O-acetyltransferase
LSASRDERNTYQGEHREVLANQGGTAKTFTPRPWRGEGFFVPFSWKEYAMVAQIEYPKTVKRPYSQVIYALDVARPKQQVQTYTFDAFPLQRGGQLETVTLAYETWGTLNAQGDNAIMITHALTANSHAHDEARPGDPKAAWWNPLIGPGRFFDTSRFFVICSNILAGCNGSTGPTSIDPHTGRPYGMRFPIVTIRDMVNAQYKLVKHLGVKELAMVAGGSIGGQQALEWAVNYPDFVRKTVVLAATAAISAQAIAFNEVGRQAIMADPLWYCGDYLPSQGPQTGLAIARMLAMITYQGEETMEMRFARKSVQREPVPSPTSSPNIGGRFDVENYLYYQGMALTQRFDANSYLYITRAMDLYDASEGYPSLEDAMKRIRSTMLFIGIRSDFLFPAAHVHQLAQKVSTLGGNATYVELNSPHGHDAFLKDWPLLTEALQHIEL